MPVRLSSWTEIFDAFQAATGLFSNGAYDLPSSSNPRLAGGMHWTANEYLAFLRALFTGTLLSDASRAALFANQRGTATVSFSPVTTPLAEDWVYGLGNWLECTSTTFDCGQGHRNSSPGAYGAYPFIDFDGAYFGLLARQGGLGTGFLGVNLVREVQPAIDAWATATCDD